MQQEIQVAIEGIVDLKQNTDYLKDYLFPIASAFLLLFLVQRLHILLIGIKN